VRPLGTIMCLGFIPQVEFNLKQITFKAAQLVGSIGGTGEFPAVLDFIARRPELAGQIVSHRLPMADYHQAFALAADRQAAMKVLLKF